MRWRFSGGTGWCVGLAVSLLVPPAAPAQDQDVWRSPGGVAVSPDGRNVYVSGRQGLLTLARSPADGSLALRGFHRDWLGGFVSISPDGTSVYSSPGTTAPGSRTALKAFRRAQDGALTPIGVDESAGRAIATMQAPIAPAGDRLYTPSSYAGIGIYARAPAGELRLLRRVDGPDGPVVAGPMAVDGAGRLYTGTGYFAEKIAVYEPAGDSVRLVQTVPCNCYAPTMHLTGDGTRLVMGTSPTPTALERDPATGRLGAEVTGFGTADALGVGAGPMATVGSSTYLLGDDRLHHTRFAGDRWELLRTHRNGVDGATGLAHAKSIAASPDGRNVYVAAGDVRDTGPPGTVAVFARDPATGQLRFASLFVGPHPRPSIAVSINGGARFTSTRRVTVTVTPSYDGVALSNDGGFLRPAFFAASANRTYPWTLAPSRGGRLPKTVYVRSGGALASDSIVLDEAAPRVVAVRRAAARRGRDRVRVRGRDALSGVSRVQVTANRRKPGRWKRYSSRTRHSVPARRRVYVRVRDRAGNASRWRAVARRAAKGKRR